MLVATERGPNVPPTGLPEEEASDIVSTKPRDIADLARRDS